MSVRGLYILMAFGVAGSWAITKFCYTCTGVHDPAVCTAVQKCIKDQVLCGTQVHQEFGETRFDLGCFNIHDCQLSTAALLIGKRGDHHQVQYLCRQCCFHDSCNTHLCQAYLPSQPGITAQPPHNAPTTAEYVPGCYTCKDVSDPALCTTIKTCGHHDVCGMEVMVAHDGSPSFTLGCVNAKECDLPHHQAVCKKCCGTSHCNNKHLCIASQSSSGSAITTSSSASAPSNAVTHVSFTTPATFTTSGSFSATAASTGAVSSTSTDSGGALPCVDIEENGFLCASFDQMNFCTDTNSFVHSLAVKNCRAHCEFCIPKPQVTNKTTTTVKPETITTVKPETNATTHAAVPTTTSKPCVDDESQGFLCSDYDAYNFCTDIHSFAHMYANDRCQKHCGFCS